MNKLPITAAIVKERHTPFSMADELQRNCAAAAIAGFIQPAIFNPLDALRVRWQVAASSGSGKSSIIGFASEIIQREGFVCGLYLPGQPWNCIAVALSQGLRLGLYPTVRDALMSGESVRPDLMAFAGFLSGSLAYFVSAPLWLLKTRAQAAPQLGTSLRAPPLPATLGQYWTGCTPLVLRGALITAGWTSGYDASKRVLKQQRLKDGPVLQGLAGLMAGLTAATLSAPSDVLQTRMQSGKQQLGVLGSVQAIWTTEGAAGFFRGWSVSVARLVPTVILGSLIYENARQFLGLKYLR